MGKKQHKSNARQRILETAERLFYAEGLRSVGIDRIIAEAEVAKMTLYNHFASKDDLILEVLKYREGQVHDFFSSSIDRSMKSGKSRLDAFFIALKKWFSSSGFRGCSFINAAVELADANHPASKFAADHKCRFREMIKEIVIEVAGKKASAIAPAIAVLVEGAIVTAVIEGSPHAADVAKEATLKLIPKSKRK